MPKLKPPPGAAVGAADVVNWTLVPKLNPPNEAPPPAVVAAAVAACATAAVAGAAGWG